MVRVKLTIQDHLGRIAEMNDKKIDIHLAPTISQLSTNYLFCNSSSVEISRIYMRHLEILSDGETSHKSSSVLAASTLVQELPCSTLILALPVTKYHSKNIAP